jgi:hypothetical protein
VDRLSIIIPCREVDAQVEDTLVSVLENRPPQCRVLVVTAGQYHDPYDLAGEVDFIEEDPLASLVVLANRGIREADGRVVHVLQPGCLAGEGWTTRAVAHFDDPHVGSVSPAAVRTVSDDRALWLGVGYWACGVRRVVGRGAKLTDERAGHHVVLGPTFAAGFYRRDAVLALGGFDEGLDPPSADVDLALALREMGMRSVVEPASRIVGRRDLIRPAGVFQSARRQERLYRRYLPGRRLTRFAHGMVAAWDVLSAFPRPRLLARLAGRLAAWCERGDLARQQQRLREAKERLAEPPVAERQVTLRVDYSERRSKAKPRTAAGERRRRAA